MACSVLKPIGSHANQRAVNQGAVVIKPRGGSFYLEEMKTVEVEGLRRSPFRDRGLDRVGLYTPHVHRDISEPPLGLHTPFELSSM
jgi:hypothetical protein